MRTYAVNHYQGTDELPDFNQAAARGRREQGRALRAAFDWLAARHRAARGPRARHGG